MSDQLDDALTHFKLIQLNIQMKSFLNDLVSKKWKRDESRTDRLVAYDDKYGNDPKQAPWKKYDDDAAKVLGGQANMGDADRQMNLEGQEVSASGAGISGSEQSAQFLSAAGVKDPAKIEAILQEFKERTKRIESSQGAMNMSRIKEALVASLRQNGFAPKKDQGGNMLQVGDAMAKRIYSETHTQYEEPQGDQPIVDNPTEEYPQGATQQTDSFNPAPSPEQPQPEQPKLPPVEEHAGVEGGEGSAQIGQPPLHDESFSIEDRYLESRNGPEGVESQIHELEPNIKQPLDMTAGQPELQPPPAADPEAAKIQAEAEATKQEATLAAESQQQELAHNDAKLQQELEHGDIKLQNELEMGRKREEAKAAAEAAAMGMPMPPTEIPVDEQGMAPTELTSPGMDGMVPEVAPEPGMAPEAQPQLDSAMAAEGSMGGEQDPMEIPLDDQGMAPMEIPAEQMRTSMPGAEEEEAAAAGAFPPPQEEEMVPPEMGMPQEEPQFQQPPTEGELPPEAYDTMAEQPPIPEEMAQPEAMPEQQPQAGTEIPVDESGMAPMEQPLPVEPEVAAPVDPEAAFDESNIYETAPAQMPKGRQSNEDMAQYADRIEKTRMNAEQRLQNRMARENLSDYSEMFADLQGDMSMLEQHGIMPKPHEIVVDQNRLDEFLERLDGVGAGVSIPEHAFDDNAVILFNKADRWYEPAVKGGKAVFRVWSPEMPTTAKGGRQIKSVYSPEHQADGRWRNAVRLQMPEVRKTLKEHILGSGRNAPPTAGQKPYMSWAAKEAVQNGMIDTFDGQIPFIHMALYHTKIRIDKSGSTTEGFGLSSLQAQHIRPNEDGTLTISYKPMKTPKNTPPHNVLVTDPVLVAGFNRLYSKAAVGGPETPIFQGHMEDIYDAVSKSMPQASAWGQMTPHDYRTMGAHDAEEKYAQQGLAKGLKGRQLAIFVHKGVASELGDTAQTAEHSYSRYSGQEDYQPYEDFTSGESGNQLPPPMIPGGMPQGAEVPAEWNQYYHANDVPARQPLIRRAMPSDGFDSFEEDPTDHFANNDTAQLPLPDWLTPYWDEKSDYPTTYLSPQFLQSMRAQIEAEGPLTQEGLNTTAEQQPNEAFGKDDQSSF